MRIILLLLFMLILFGCQNHAKPDLYSYGEEFELKFGESARIGGDAISIEFLDILEDSRYPVNVECVWAGNGQISLQLARETFQLNTYLYPKDSTISNINVQLLSLKPYPE